jgi:Outer membrane protein beta-barrel domain
MLMFGSQMFVSQPVATPSRSITFFALSSSPSRFRARLTHMPKSLAVLLLAALAVCANPAHAQAPRRRETSEMRKIRIQKQLAETYTHRWEAEGGGGFLRFRSGELLQKNSEIAFFGGATYFFNPKLGITGEVRGAYGNAKVGNNPYITFNPQISEYPFLAGPTYRLRTTVKTSIAAFALGGVAMGKFDGGSKGFTAPQLGMWPDTLARPAFSVGANFDYNLYPNLAFRVAPTYTGTTFGGTLQSNFGFNAGLVVRFGHQKTK